MIDSDFENIVDLLEKREDLKGTLWRYQIATFAEHVSQGRWTAYPWLKYLLTEIQVAVTQPGARIVVTAPPRHGKSEALSHYLPLWYLDWNTDKRVILASYSDALAVQFSLKVRQDFQIHADKLKAKVSAERYLVDDWHTTDHGGMRATGIGGSLTGMGGHLLIVDDPHKDWSEANSPTIRKKVVDWFNSVLSLRAEPGASIVVVQCMTGDTQVLMSGGDEKCLKDIVPGDVVATYNAGRIETARINNWINNGLDSVFTIKTTSGVFVKANARHPFLAARNGRLKWTRLKNLKVGDTILRVIGAGGAESNAKSKVAICPRRVKDFVPHTIANGSMPKDTSRQAAIRNPEEMPISNTDTESLSLSTKPSSKNSMGSVPFAGSPHHKKTPAPTGIKNSALTTCTEPNRSEDCCATTAILPSDMGRPNEFCSPLLNTYEIVLDTIAEIIESGLEDVFDIEVDRTGNFIANGLVSHNTRWHEDDLAGYLLREHKDRWREIRLPALSEGDGDLLARPEGQALCPERYDEIQIKRVKQSVGSFMFAGLYQQRPAPLEGVMVKRDSFRRWSTLPDHFSTVIQSWDLTFKATGSSYIVGQVWGAAPHSNGTVYKSHFYLIDQIREKLSFMDTIKRIYELSERHESAVVKLIEDKANGPAIMSALKDQVPGIVAYSPRGSKEARLAAVSGLIEAGNVFIPEKSIASWSDDFVEEVATFPHGRNDDQVDAMTMALDHLIHKRAEYRTDFSISEAGFRANPWRM